MTYFLITLQFLDSFTFKIYYLCKYPKCSVLIAMSIIMTPVGEIIFIYSELIPPLLEKSVRFSFPVVWNSIPNNISSYKNLRLFKKSLKRYFVLRYS